MVQFIGGKPSRPLRRPNRRHFLINVGVSSRPKRQNTVIRSWVDVASDVRAINDGHGIRAGNTVTLNQRTYGIKPNATLYPISGPGFVFLDRGAYKALGYYNDFGVSELAEEEMNRALISTQSRERARYVPETGDRDE